MGRFIIHGIVVEEPKTNTTSNGIDMCNVVVEEKYSTPTKREVINTYSIDYMGKAVNCIPAGVRLVGCPVVVTGLLKSRQYNGKYYNDLQGDTFSIIDINSVIDKPIASNLDVIDMPQESSEDIIMPDDDLPF